MKKLIALLLVLGLLLTALPAFASSVPLDDDEAGVGDMPDSETEEPVVLTPSEIALLGRPVSDTPTHLTIGNSTKVSGSFFTGLWSNNTSDIDVRTVLHGYNTVAWNSQVEFVINPTVVENMEARTVRRNTVYTLTIQKDLTYNDGVTPITARDFVFSYLLCASPEAAELEAVSTQFQHIVGYEDYHDGKSQVFSGIRLIDDYTYSVTVKNAYEPFFFETAYVRCDPYPISVLAPYCEVRDEGKGVFLHSVDPEEEEAPFTADILRETIFNPNTGYMSHPALTTGPYTLTGYDAASGRVDLEINEYYKGNFEGVKPVINTLTLLPVLPDTMVESLKDGTVGLLNKCVDAAVITDAMGLLGTGFDMANYARIGYGYCAFTCEKGPAQYQAVRQAIAYSFDADAFLKTYLGDYGMAVYGYYGMAQWMTLAAMGTMRPDPITPKESAEWDKLTLDELNHYDPNPELALDLLVRDGWTLNENGEPFDPAKDKVRYKDVDGELMRLTINFAQCERNEGADLVVAQLKKTLPALGIEFLPEVIPFSELLNDFYRKDGQRHYDMNFMATNFNSVFDPYFTFVTDPTIQGAVNTSGINDKKLMDYAWDMHDTEPMAFLEYEQDWLAFQMRFNELLPTMPLYSNVYFDFHTDWLQNYEPASAYSWADAIVYAYIAEPVAEEQPNEGLSLVPVDDEGDENETPEDEAGDEDDIIIIE